VHVVLETMEQLATGERDVVAKQSVDVIRTLLAVDSPSASASGNLRLDNSLFRDD